MPLPISTVAEPGARENFQYIEERTLLPQLGFVVLAPSGAVPAGWRAADGAPVGRDEFRDLFISIGTTYGPGDGTTTFNLPDLAGLEPLAQQTYIVRVR